MLQRQKIVVGVYKYKPRRVNIIITLDFTWNYFSGEMNCATVESSSDYYTSRSIKDYIEQMKHPTE